MKLSEGVEQKLKQERVTEETAKEFFEELQERGLIQEGVTFDDPGVREATILYCLKDSLTEEGRLSQLDEVGLNSLEIRRQFLKHVSLI